MTSPTIRTLHLGAGRQSTTIALLIAQGHLPKPDHVLFADTGSEPAAVYTHLERVKTELLKPAGVPLHLVSRGNLAEDVRNPNVYAKIPAYTLELTPVTRGFLSWDDRKEGRIQRQCTGRYKVEPLERATRELLGAQVWLKECRYCDGTGQRVAPWIAKASAVAPDQTLAPDLTPGPCSVCRGTGSRKLVGVVPRGAVAEAWIGFDAVEAAMRINEATFPAYMKPSYPLLDLPRPPDRVADDARRGRRVRETGWSVEDCVWYLGQHGWPNVPKSACFMCPFTSNARWRKIKREDPQTWQRAVEYDQDIRTGPGLRAQRFLHEDRVPLGQARIERRTSTELAKAQTDIFDLIADQEDEDSGGCSPWGCHVGPEVSA